MDVTQALIHEPRSGRGLCWEGEGLWSEFGCRCALGPCFVLDKAGEVTSYLQVTLGPALAGLWWGRQIQCEWGEAAEDA